MRESTIKRKILHFLRSLPESDWEVSPPGSIAGKFDLTGCLKGRYVALEVKSENGRLTRLQRYKLERLKAAGAVVGIPRSVEDAQIILEYHGLYSR